MATGSELETNSRRTKAKISGKKNKRNRKTATSDGSGEQTIAKGMLGTKASRSAHTNKTSKASETRNRKKELMSTKRRTTHTTKSKQTKPGSQ